MKNLRILFLVGGMGFALLNVSKGALFQMNMQEMVSIQMMPIAHNTLITYCFSDSTKEKTGEYSPFTASIGMNLAALNGYFHIDPKFVYEMNITGDEFTFKGIGGAVAFEIHPFKNTAFDPYFYTDLGLMKMADMEYVGLGYHIDFGVGAIFQVRSTVQISPFVAFTPLSKWQQRNQIGYSAPFPEGNLQPAYAGHDCQHVGIRMGFAVLFRFLER